MIAVMMLLAMAAAEVNPTRTDPEPLAAAQPAKEDLNKIKCVRQAPTGTRFEKRICKTLHEWYRQGKAAQADLKQVQDRPMTQICPPSGC